jgi:hypothetical protein
MHPRLPHRFIVQAAVAQSLGAAHTRKSSHRGHVVVPPQSTSVSPPLITPSVQVGALHVIAVASQTPLAQSAPSRQTSPVSQGSHVTPPQSTSASSAFWTPSSHDGA